MSLREVCRDDKMGAFKDDEEGERSFYYINSIEIKTRTTASDGIPLLFVRERPGWSRTVVS